MKKLTTKEMLKARGGNTCGSDGFCTCCGDAEGFCCGCRGTGIICKPWSK